MQFIDDLQHSIESAHFFWEDFDLPRWICVKHFGISPPQVNNLREMRAWVRKEAEADVVSCRTRILEDTAERLRFETRGWNRHDVVREFVCTKQEVNVMTLWL